MVFIQCSRGGGVEGVRGVGSCSLRTALVVSPPPP